MKRLWPSFRAICGLSGAHTCGGRRSARLVLVRTVAIHVQPSAQCRDARTDGGWHTDIRCGRVGAALGGQGQSRIVELPGRVPMRDRLLQIGLIGTGIAALCCFTPLLVWLLAAIGLSATVAYLDFVLLPALAIFIAITGYALWRLRRPN